MIFKLEAVGRLTDDAKVINGGTDKAFMSFSVAVNNKYKDKTTGEVKEKTYFIDCTKNGDRIAEYMKKGGTVAIIGHPYADSYTNNDGCTVNKLCCKVQQIELLGSSQQKQPQEKPQDEVVVF